MRKVLIIIFFLTFSVGFVSAELDLTVNAQLNGFNTDFKAITDSDANAGYDGFDLVAPTTPSNYSRFYSVIGSNLLAVDVWPSDSNPRTLNLVYDSSPQTSGNLSLSWGFFDAHFGAVLKDYGTDAGRTSLNSTIDMNEEQSYSVSSNGIRYFTLTISNIEVPVASSSGSSGGGGGGGGATSSLLRNQCNESRVCTEWNVCQNLETSFEGKTISGGDYLLFKSNCTANGFNYSNCGFQTRTCNVIDLCNNLSIAPLQSQSCQYVENPSCSDDVKNCHDGKCEVLTDCGGPCMACATCSDGIKNQAEKGIDCGGPCPDKCNKVPLKDLLNKKKIALYIYLILTFMLIGFLIVFIVKVIKWIR